VASVRGKVGGGKKAKSERPKAEIEAIRVIREIRSSMFRCLVPSLFNRQQNCHWESRMRKSVFIRG